MLGLLSPFDLILEVQDVEAQILILVFEFLQIRRIFPPLLEVLYLLLLQPALLLQFRVLGLKHFQGLAELLLNFSQQSLVVLDGPFQIYSGSTI